MRRLLCRWLGAQPLEPSALGWAFANFFLLRWGYSILWPVLAFRLLAQIGTGGNNGRGDHLDEK
jgi:hypothetical protein